MQPAITPAGRENAHGAKTRGTVATTPTPSCSAMPPRLSGCLELTWTNKDQALVAHPDGSYEWVAPDDYRVAEVRLLNDAGTVGEVAGDKQRAQDNLLIRGDSLDALTSLSKLPEFSKEYLGKVKLVYIDPPFNTGQAFTQYDDALEHSVWLTMMRDRLELIRDLLSPDGSVWVHLDDAEMAYCRILMDEVFGRDNFVASVIWEKSDSPRMDAHNFSARHDYILVYSRSNKFRVNRLGKGEAQAHYNKTDENGVLYYLKPLRAMGGQGSTRVARPTLYYAIDAPDGTKVWPKLPDGGDGAWRWKRDKVKRDQQLIEWVDGQKGWSPYFRIYDKGEGRPPETIWTHGEVGSNRTSKKEVKQLAPDVTPFDTPKPEKLLQRIIDIATNPGDIVLDCFGGSGATAATAHKMARRWVSVERSRDTIQTYQVPRLTKVVEGSDPGGITSDVDWQGGDAFRILDVSESMFHDDDGVVVIADWAVHNKLAEATAAQLGYVYELDAPFCGRKGRTRLAVIDGNVSADVVRILAGALPDGEKLVVCGTSVDPDAAQTLRELSKGSRVRNIPASILAHYRTAGVWQPQAAGQSGSTGTVKTS